MKAISSEIQLMSFVVLQSSYQFVPAPKKVKNTATFFKSYELDIDFAHHEEDENNIRVFTKISVNNCDKALPGYQLMVEGFAVFSIENCKDLPEKEANNLKYFSTVNILIGYLRNTLMSLTASAPWGPYLLPPINMSDLFNKKSNSTTDPEGHLDSAR